MLLFKNLMKLWLNQLFNYLILSASLAHGTVQAAPTAIAHRTIHLEKEPVYLLPEPFELHTSYTTQIEQMG